MNVGIIGLGRMGLAIAQRILNAGHTVVGFDLSKELMGQLTMMGGDTTDLIEQVAQQARIIWLMVPAGEVVDSVIEQLLPHLKGGDIVVDGGNSNFHDSMRRADLFAARDMFFLDCGTSGGLHGKAVGFCLMVGGDKAAYTKIYPLLEAIAMPEGVGYMGPSGTGHYVKMVHNGIEYALLQAYAEGLHVIKEGTFKDQVLDLDEITRVWNNGSIIRSFILQLLHDIVQKDQELKNISGEVAATGMGKWTVEEAEQRNIPVDLIKRSLEIRDWSQQTGGNYATKLVSMLRNSFGGHEFKKIEK
ncbi:decarboxylating 6-phosphogluconate dehydrogenase [Candidatus Dependentiae bacterium]|nr:decarboxylating 6-phosphogluconate dehydrogenase [Candidatus Dependentiae bacterium]